MNYQRVGVKLTPKSEGNGLQKVGTRWELIFPYTVFPFTIRPVRHRHSSLIRVRSEVQVLQDPPLTETRKPLLITA